VLISAAVVLAMLGVAMTQMLAANAGLPMPWAAGLAVAVGTGGTAWFIRGLARIEVPAGDWSAPVLLWAAVLGLALAVFGVGAMEFLAQLSPVAAERMLNVQASYDALLQPENPWMIPAVLLCVAVAPALFEEVLFRGVLRELLHSAVPLVRVLVIGALFAFIHWEPVVMLPLFYVGCMLTLLADRTGGWAAAAVAHFALNATNGVVSVRVLDGVDFTFTMAAVVMWVGVTGATMATLKIFRCLERAAALSTNHKSAVSEADSE
jgi:membrane protease YdiL (CAAX protease family)